MRTLYLDCGMGAAGDMLTAALLELLSEEERVAFLEKMNHLGIPGVEVKAEIATKCGINGTHVSVLIHGGEEGQEHHHHHHEHEHDHDHEHEHDHDHEHEHDHHHDHGHDHEHEHHHDHDHDHDHGHHHHSGMHDIEHIVRGHMDIPEKVKDDVMAVYGLIAEAESHAHGKPVTEIHFHEVGTLDAVADVTAVCLLMNQIAPEQVIVSPIHVGSGHVHCVHGILPVPAPATAYILKDVPIYGGQIKGELCTPTGAALLKHFADKFGSMPVMAAEAIGYGMGKKDFEQANCVRAMVGDSLETGESLNGSTDTIVELKCNVDDMSAEQIGFAMDRIMEAGAVDVYTIAIGMKKSRPGCMICMLVKEDKKAPVVKAAFKYTTTIGIRESIQKRYVLDRSMDTIKTPLGDVRCKNVSGYEVSRSKYEYEDLAAIAKENNLSLEEVTEVVRTSEE